MKFYLKRVIGAVLAASLVIGLSFFASDARLRASDEEVLPVVVEEYIPEPEPVYEPVEVIVEQNEDYTLSEVVPADEAPAAQEAPAEETPAAEEVIEEQDYAIEVVDAEAEQTAEEEELAAEEAEEVREVFDLAEAYSRYISLSDAEKEAFLDSLTPENREALLNYIAEMESAAAENEAPAPVDYSKLRYSFSSDHAGQQVEPGTEITLTAKLTGFEGLDYTCYWQYSADGSSFTDAGTGDSFSFEASEENANWVWRLTVGVEQ